MGKSVSINRLSELKPDSDQRSSLNRAVINYVEDYLAYTERGAIDGRKQR